MVLATNLGYPRIGQKRELKKALERFWSGQCTEEELLNQAANLRQQHWSLQQQLGLQHIPSNDFSLYDQVLDTIALVGAVPPRYHWSGDHVELSTYFAMARGMRLDSEQDQAVAALEMTKWFDTNYHYIVPEFEVQQEFCLASRKPIDEFNEARALGIHTRPVLLGPITFLLLGKVRQGNVDPLELLDRLLPVYEEVLRELATAGADWVQIDEPCLVQDLDSDVQAVLQKTYERLSAVAPSLHLLLATYFGDTGSNLPLVLHLPVAGVHLDLVRAPQQLKLALQEAPASLTLSLGVIDGRNVWRTDLDHVQELIAQALQERASESIMIAPSCSLLHVPVDLKQETLLDSELKQWLAFARQKIEEVVLLTRLINHGPEGVEEHVEEYREAQLRRRVSPRIHNQQVGERVSVVIGREARRHSPYEHRRQEQQRQLNLPLLPTTTIGSFPQTDSVRAARAAYKSGKQDLQQYESFLRAEIKRTVHFQEEIGLDVLVHGEFERSDMVEYFGEQLDGFLFMQQGWVQSYGSRCVRPPIIYGDVTRPEPMTIYWSRFAQSLTERPVKGMLTGPVTILQWSFVRDDQPQKETCYQLALALREEVLDLEVAGIRVIQIDEPALREGLPLRRSEWPEYLDWAVNCFRLVSADVRDETQIHTHMCYGEFQDIIEAIGAMDADVLSIEASRSQLELLDTFIAYQYPNQIGPGIYDIHSPRIPSVEEYEEILKRILQVLPAEQIWVNPDCGLKTRHWEEVQPALTHLVEAARGLRLALEARV